MVAGSGRWLASQASTGQFSLDACREAALRRIMMWFFRWWFSGSSRASTLMASMTAWSLSRRSGRLSGKIASASTIAVPRFSLTQSSFTPRNRANR